MSKSALGTITAAVAMLRTYARQHEPHAHEVADALDALASPLSTEGAPVTLATALVSIATLYESSSNCSLIERANQAYDMRCVARRALQDAPLRAEGAPIAPVITDEMVHQAAERFSVCLGARGISLFMGKYYESVADFRADVRKALVAAAPLPTGGGEAELSSVRADVKNVLARLTIVEWRTPSQTSGLGDAIARLHVFANGTSTAPTGGAPASDVEEDAARGRYCVKYAGWRRDHDDVTGEDRTWLAVPVAAHADLSSVGLRKDALDEAIRASAPTGGATRGAPKVQELYDELLYAVAKKFPNESRHQTALRDIQQAEVSRISGPQVPASDEQGE